MPESPAYRRAMLRGATLLPGIESHGSDPDSPDYERDEYLDMMPEVERARALFAGTDAMRDAGEKYLPRHIRELQEDYDRRRKAARLYNAFRRTVRAYVGMVTRKQPRIVDSTPEIEAHAENIDLAGRDLPTFVGDVLEDALIAGHTFILVDYPVTAVEEPDGTVRAMNLAEERAAAVRPYWLHVRKDDLVNWRYDYVNGAPVLTLAVIRETVTEDEGTYGTEDVEQIRVLRPGSVEVFRQEGESKEWQSQGVQTTTLSYIPLVPVYTNREGFLRSSPPLTDLIHENIGHWQESSEHVSAIARNRIVMPFFSGFDPETVVWGNNYSISTTATDATATLLEVTGAAMEASRQVLQDIEQRMAALGLSMLVRESRAAETAQARTIDKTESDSSLARVAHALGDALELALWYHADWMGVDRALAGGIEINKDYKGLEMSPQMVQALSALVTAKQYRHVDFLAALQRGEMLDDSVNVEELAAELEVEAEAQMERMMQMGMQMPPEEEEPEE